MVQYSITNIWILVFRWSVWPVQNPPTPQMQLSKRRFGSNSSFLLGVVLGGAGWLKRPTPCISPVVVVNYLSYCSSVSVVLAYYGSHPSVFSVVARNVSVYVCMCIYIYMYVHVYYKSTLCVILIGYSMEAGSQDARDLVCPKPTLPQVLIRCSWSSVPRAFGCRWMLQGTSESTRLPVNGL